MTSATCGCGVTMRGLILLGVNLSLCAAWSAPVPRRPHVLRAVAASPAAVPRTPEVVSTSLRLASVCVASIRGEIVVHAAAAATAAVTALRSGRRLLALGYAAVIMCVGLLPIHAAWRLALGVCCAAALETLTTKRVTEPPAPSNYTTVPVPPPPTVKIPTPKASLQYEPKVLQPVPAKPYVAVPKSTKVNATPKNATPKATRAKRVVPLLEESPKDDYVGTWRLGDGNEIILSEGGEASTAPSFSQETRWERKRNGELEVSLQTPRLTPSGIFAGFVPTLLTGKLVSENRIAGALQSKVMGVDISSNVTMQKVPTVTPTSSY